MHCDTYRRRCHLCICRHSCKRSKEIKFPCEVSNFPSDFKNRVCACVCICVYAVYKDHSPAAVAYHNTPSSFFAAEVKCIKHYVCYCSTVQNIHALNMYRFFYRREKQKNEKSCVCVCVFTITRCMEKNDCARQNNGILIAITFLHSTTTCYHALLSHS